MGRNGTLNINGGAVTAAGTGKNGVFVRGNFRSLTGAVASIDNLLLGEIETAF